MRRVPACPTGPEEFATRSAGQGSPAWLIGDGSYLSLELRASASEMERHNFFGGRGRRDVVKVHIAQVPPEISQRQGANT